MQAADNIIFPAPMAHSVQLWLERGTGFASRSGGRSSRLCIIYIYSTDFTKWDRFFYQWLACVNASQPVISPGASPTRQAQNLLCRAHEMSSSPDTVRAKKIYPPKSYLGLHPRIMCDGLHGCCEPCVISPGWPGSH